jgi:DhnA family fructose-bisphosphate aldolase class Ia
MKKNTQILIPADVPHKMEKEFIHNYQAITKKTNRLMLFSCDQKIEHLNKNFYGPGIPQEVNDPEHLFKIASQGTIGAMATHLGLIDQYGKKYPTIHYIVKLNAKTNLVPSEQQDPISTELWDVRQVLDFKEETDLSICGIGYTIYLGSEHESKMLSQAADAIFQAHEHGLVAIVWMYPRGKAIPDENDPDLIAGAAGVAASLGADFAKIKTPEINGKRDPALLQQAVFAAGNTKLICSGGSRIQPKQFLQELYNQIHSGGTAGSATGRNIFQHPLQEAIAMTNAIASIVYENATAENAFAIYEQNK